MLGDRFLQRLYRAVTEDPESVAVVAGNGARVVGFAAGVRSVDRFYSRFYRRHGIAAGLCAAPRLVRPGVLRRAWETVTYRDRQAGMPDAELVAIAVASSTRAQGVGRALAREVIDGLDRLGAGRIKVVVATDNVQANRFYERIGFSPLCRIAVHRDEPSNVWEIACPSSLRSASA
jgi:ribosomal protein S18 acetylase RimI-like enzyme